MNKLYALIKVELISITHINKLRKIGAKSSAAKLVLFAAVFIAVISVITLYMYNYFSLFADLFEQMGMLNLLPLIAILSSSIITFFTALYSVQGVLFKFKDYEIVYAMPIKPSVIMSSKMIMLYLVNFLFGFVTFIAPTIVYIERVGGGATDILLSVVVALFLPLIPIVTASLVGMGISYLASRTRFKNLLSIVGIVGFCGVMILFFTNSISGISTDIQGLLQSVISAIQTWYYPGYMLAQSIANGDILSLVVGAGISLAVFILFVLLFSKFFTTINTKLTQTHRRKSYKLGEVRSSSPFMALYKRELKNYFSISIYVFNTAFSAAFTVILGFAVLFTGADMIAGMFELPEISGLMPQVITVVLCFLMTVSPTTSSTISLEGSRLWILQSLPVNAISIFRSKIAVNLTLNLPAVIFSAVGVGLRIGMGISDILLLISLPTVALLYMSYMGLVINLHFPKLDWTSEAYVVKQSMSSFLTVIIGMASVAIPTIIFVLLGNVDFAVFVSVVAVIFILLTVCLDILLRVSGRKLFYKLG